MKQEWKEMRTYSIFDFISHNKRTRKKLLKPVWTHKNLQVGISEKTDSRSINLNDWLCILPLEICTRWLWEIKNYFYQREGFNITNERVKGNNLLWESLGPDLEKKEEQQENKHFPPRRDSSKESVPVWKGFNCSSSDHRENENWLWIVSKKLTSTYQAVLPGSL